MCMPRRTHTTSFALTLGARMRSLRLEQGMSLSQLSRATGISKGHLSTIELGFAAITTESLERIAQGLELPPMYLLVFPENDEDGAIADLVRQLPTTHMKKLRRILTKWIKELETRD